MAMTTNERIVRKSLELFSRFGINSVRTEDISAELGISKKTFYKHFVSKEELVVCVTERLLSDALSEIDKPVKNCCNSIVQASILWDTIIGFRKKHNPNFINDVKRYYARAWNLVETFRTEYLTSVLIQNLKRGVLQSFYRADMNEKVMAWLWMDLCQLEYNANDSDAEIKHHFIRGLLSRQGFENYAKELCDKENMKELTGSFTG
jgi:AcrR family transcriptional regulator